MGTIRDTAAARRRAGLHRGRLRSCSWRCCGGEDALPGDRFPIPKLRPFVRLAADGIRWDSPTIEDGTLRFLLGGKTAGLLEILPDDSVKARELGGRSGCSAGPWHRVGWGPD